MAKDLIPVVTPVGELWYVNITGQGKQNYNEDGYEFVATVNLIGQAAEDLKAKILEVLGPVPAGKIVKSTGFRELLKDAEGNVFTPTANKKEGTPTGITAFTFKTGATFEDGRPKKVAVYNTAAQKVDMADRLIGNGSKGAISGKMQRNERGKEVMVSLFLNAVQLTEYIPYSGDAGFEAQEGGSFTAPTDGESGFSGQPDKSAEAPIPAEQTVKAKPRL